ncbi:ADP-ribosylglycohydrolase family protein [Phytohalomonas tamaricis]|uniref:ADP-ribosylglycohydrolase family protein n=1 Tax=Phytohalomonas tamaricis TaxID=2081032 RepID=UPI000D0BC049|nr:ADP-ribosylglycohydrolase family protein [Phytohalomonas tamaricis]
MLGAIAGDIIGSIHEGYAAQDKTFALFTPASRFTDDSVMTIAVASVRRQGEDYVTALRRWGRRYPDAGYGGRFKQWLVVREPKPYNSFGNGSAMRVSPVGWAFDALDYVLAEARRSAEVTHDHPEGIKGAQAVAGAVWLARHGGDKKQIRQFFTERFGYDCSASLVQLREHSHFDVTCQGTVPAAAVAFLEAEDFEDAIRNAVSLGGDADTLACISGALAQAYYGSVPDAIRHEVLARLDQPLRHEVEAFTQRYGGGN